MARLAVYGAVSAALATSVILVAFAQRSNFYSASIYLYKSNACMMILLNLGLFLTVVLGQLVQWIFFGTLRPLEVEHLYERAWYTITETCLAMTIFRDEFDTRFVVMFTVLLFFKVFHWLCQDRVDSMEQSPGLPLSFHVRMVSMMSFLIYIDVVMVSSAIAHFFLQPPNMMIMFAFEYTLLATSLAAAFGKYTLHTIDMQSEEPWENKSMLLFYLDLLADFVKLATYLMFFMVILIYYGLPVHIIRDVYMTLRSFLQKCRDLIQYRMATRNMNERYPDATPADLAALSDPICIICREEMVSAAQPAAAAAAAAAAGQDANGNPVRPATPRSAALSNVPKKLPCGHIFHFHCLKSWLERQQSCPTCRRMVLDPPTAGAGQPVAGDAAPAGAAAAAPAAAAAAAGGGGRAGAGAAVNGAPGAGFNANGQPNGALGVPGQAGAQGQGQLPHGVGFPLFFGLPGHHLAMGGIHPYIMGGIPAGGPVAAANPAVPVAGGGGVGGADGRQPAGGATHPVAPPNAPPTYTLPHVTHPIPGLIPLFPIEHRPIAAAGPRLQQEQTGTTARGAGDSANAATTSSSQPTASGASSGATTSSTSRLATDQIPLTSLDNLSESQLHHLESNSRRALQERLRVLQAVEHQILESISVLTQVMSVLPTPPPPLPSSPSGLGTTEAQDPPSPDLTAQRVVSDSTATAPSLLTSTTSLSSGMLHGGMPIAGATGLRSTESWAVFRNANGQLPPSSSTTASSSSTVATASTSTVNAEETNSGRTTTTTTTTVTSTVTTSSASSASSIAIAAPTPSALATSVPLLSVMEAEADNMSSSTLLPTGAAGQTTTGAASEDVTERSTHNNNSQVNGGPMKMDKGKGKKEQGQEEDKADPAAAAAIVAEAEELEEEGGGGLAPLMSSTLTGTDLSDFEDVEEEEAEEEEESTLSPQEMVRRRWAKQQSS
ncbi:E3 ubiquitin-protein ligase hrd1 [Actinomortierella ambigua]|nr:E3 ubiquitin-protein ligase hrd1 [Actinomortierella ambigua]